MSTPPRGFDLALSPARKMVAELLHHAREVPSLPLARVLDVSALVAARKRLSPAPSWMAIFLRAYGKASIEHPELRRAFIRYPWPRLYQHPYSEGSILIEREWQGETIVLGAKLRAPEELSLAFIDEHLAAWKNDPVWEVSCFRKILSYGQVPHLIRRFGFWHTLHFSGFKRARRFGTFMLSSLGTFGVEQMHPLTPLSTYFTFGPIDSGRVTAKIIYDHRVMDGGTVSRCLVSLERILNSVLLGELNALERAAAA